MFFILNLSISMDRSKALLWPWNPFHFQAFAWFSDLLVEHSEIFWSLFGVDMDTVLNEQPPDTYVYFDLYFFQNFKIFDFTDGIPFLCFWFSMIIYERMIIWKMANSTSICEQHLLHKWSDTLTWWKAQSLNLSIKVSKKKDGKSKGKNLRQKKKRSEFFSWNWRMSKHVFYLTQKSTFYPKIVWIWCLKNVNFAKTEILKMWILPKLIF